MIFLQPTIQHLKSSIDYKKTEYEIPAKYVHPIDHIEFHKQVGDMLYSTMTDKATSVQKLQNSLENIKAQLKLEKTSSQAKDNIIKYLKYLVIEVGYDPKNVKGVEKLIKKNNAEIYALKKQLKLLPTEHPQTKEVLENQNQKDDMVNLILQLIGQ